MPAIDLLDLRKLVEDQCGVLSRRQALAAGVTPAVVEWRLRSERWSRLGSGVYYARPGNPPREARLWAAVLLAGPGAALSHWTAAELFKLTDQRSSLIYVTIPERRQVRPMTGLVMYRSSRLADAVHPALLPRRTRLEETVLDLAAQATEFDAAFALVCAACQRRLTTTTKIAAAMSMRKKLRWRSELRQALGEVGGGTHSLLEYRYARYVERPHRPPAADRQAKIIAGQRSRYLDNLYPDYHLCVELDGQQAHPDDQRWQDLRRVNAIIAQGITVLRYGWTDITTRPCQVAGQIAVDLQDHGWTGRPRQCGPACALPRYPLARPRCFSP